MHAYTHAHIHNPAVYCYTNIHKIVKKVYLNRVTSNNSRTLSGTALFIIPSWCLSMGAAGEAAWRGISSGTHCPWESQCRVKPTIIGERLPIVRIRRLRVDTWLCTIKVIPWMLRRTTQVDNISMNSEKENNYDIKCFNKTVTSI